MNLNEIMFDVSNATWSHFGLWLSRLYVFASGKNFALYYATK